MHFILSNNDMLREIEGKVMKSRMVDYGSYDSLYRTKEKLVVWERLVEK